MNVINWIEQETIGNWIRNAKQGDSFILRDGSDYEVKVLATTFSELKPDDVYVWQNEDGTTEYFEGRPVTSTELLFSDELGALVSGSDEGEHSYRVNDCTVTISLTQVKE